MRKTQPILLSSAEQINECQWTKHNTMKFKEMVFFKHNLKKTIKGKTTWVINNNGPFRTEGIATKLVVLPVLLIFTAYKAE